MTTKKAIYISAISVSLILLITFGITSVLAINKNSTQIDTEVANRIAEREVAYHQLIEEANQRIQALNAQVQGVPPAGQSQSLLNADEALSIANQVAGNGQVLSGVPQLVNFQGITAYEIPFIDGMIYIDAASGAVLSNNVRSQINGQQAIEIAADYLGVKNTNTAVVKQIEVDGTEAYKVFISNYVLYVDKYGTITKFQVIQYTSPGSGSSGSSSNSDDHENDDDD